MKELLKRVVPRSLRERTYPCRERLGRVPGHLAASLRLFVKARVEGGPVEDLTAEQGPPESSQLCRASLRAQ